MPAAAIYSIVPIVTLAPLMPFASSLRMLAPAGSVVSLQLLHTIAVVTPAPPGHLMVAAPVAIVIVSPEILGVVIVQVPARLVPPPMAAILGLAPPTMIWTDLVPAHYSIPALYPHAVAVRVEPLDSHAVEALKTGRERPGCVRGREMYPLNARSERPFLPLDPHFNPPTIRGDAPDLHLSLYAIVPVRDRCTDVTPEGGVDKLVIGQGEIPEVDLAGTTSKFGLDFPSRGQLSPNIDLSLLLREGRAPHLEDQHCPYH